MKVEGNIEHLETEIKNSYKDKLAEFEKLNLGEFDKEKSAIEEHQQKAMNKVKAEMKDEERKVFKSTLAEEMLNAKKEFENKREELINNVFEQAEKKSKKVLVGKPYINFVKKMAKAKAEITGGSNSYKKEFPNVKVDPRVDGITVKDNNLIFDFTYKKFIGSRKLDLRHRISKILFENGS